MAIDAFARTERGTDSVNDKHRLASHIFGNEEIQRLLEQYLQIIGLLPIEPVISIRGLFAFYGRYLLWAIYLYLLPVVGLLNVIILLVRTLSKHRPHYIGSPMVSALGAPFQALHRGEIPALKLITFRFIVRLLVLRHIKARVRRISAYLQYIEVLGWVRGSVQAEDSANLAKASEALAKLDGVLRLGPQIRLAIGLSPLIAALGSIAKVIGIDLPKLVLGKGFDNVKGASILELAANKPEVIRWVALFVSFIAALLLVLAANFVRKREIMLEHSVYQLEKNVFALFVFGKPSEVPYDLLGYALSFGIYFTINVWLYHFSDVDGRVRIDMLLVAIFYISPFLYALYRRLILGRC